MTVARRAWLAAGGLLLAPLASPARAVSVVDDLGATVAIVSAPQRVVCLSPGAVEILYAVGAGDRLVATVEAADFPAAAKAVPRVGDMVHPSLEEILSYRPDLVIATAGPPRELLVNLARARVPVVAVVPHTLRDVLANILLAGRIFGREDPAGRIVARLDARIAAVRRRVKDSSGSTGRPRVYFELWSDPLIAVGRTGFPGELLDLAGFANIVPASAGDYPRVSSESVLAADPQVVILVRAKDPRAAVTRLAARPGWSGLAAIKTGRVYADLDTDLLMRPGPRLVDGLEMLVDVLRPASMPAAR